MAVSEVAAVALAAAAGHGFALGGGNALLAHGIIIRPTQDVDLFTVRNMASKQPPRRLRKRGAGFVVERQEADDGGLADIFPDLGEGLAEWIVSSPDGQQMVLQLAYFDRRRDPVVMDIGPVLAVETWPAAMFVPWQAGSSRDCADTARMLERYSPAELIGLARRLDPGLTARDFAEAGRQLDHIDDEAFARYGLGAPRRLLPAGTVRRLAPDCRSRQPRDASRRLGGQDPEVTP